MSRGMRRPRAVTWPDRPAAWGEMQHPPPQGWRKLDEAIDWMEAGRRRYFTFDKSASTSSILPSMSVMTSLDLAVGSKLPYAKRADRLVR